MSKKVQVHELGHKLGFIVVYRADTQDGPWEALRSDDIPDWVKNPVCMGRLVRGDMAQNPDDPHWYRADQVRESPIYGGGVVLH